MSGHQDSRQLITMSQIKLSELTFHAIVEAVPNAIVLVNKEGKIAYVNRLTEKLFGYDRMELIGQMGRDIDSGTNQKKSSSVSEYLF